MTDDLPRDAERIRSHLRRWRERLLDQTGRNPLLRREGSRISRLPIVTPDAELLLRLLAVEGRSLRLPLVRRTVRRRRSGETVELAGAPDESLRIENGEIVFAAGAAELLRKLRRIRDNARTSLEERGVTTLHLALGALHFSDHRLGGDCAAPLWLLPCRLESHGPDRPLTLGPADEDPSVNPSLELYLRERHKLHLPATPEEPSLDGFQRVLDTVFDEAAERGWRVEPEAWLSTFSFESLVLWRDLEAMESEALRHPVVRAFARAPVDVDTEARLPADLDTLPTPEQVPVPILETDSSQLEALTLAAGGRNLVVHGPPPGARGDRRGVARGVRPRRAGPSHDAGARRRARTRAARRTREARLVHAHAACEEPRRPPRARPAARRARNALRPRGPRRVRAPLPLRVGVGRSSLRRGARRLPGRAAGDADHALPRDRRRRAPCRAPRRARGGAPRRLVRARSVARRLCARTRSGDPSPRAREAPLDEAAAAALRRGASRAPGPQALHAHEPGLGLHLAASRLGDVRPRRVRRGLADPDAAGRSGDPPRRADRRGRRSQTASAVLVLRRVTGGERGRRRRGRRAAGVAARRVRRGRARLPRSAPALALPQPGRAPHPVLEPLVLRGPADHVPLDRGVV